MPEVSFVNLLVVVAVAVLAPLLLGFLPKLRVPSVVVEIVGGVVLGPSVLGWVEVDLPVEVLAVIGLAFLLVLAGLEIDLRTLRGRTLRVAGLGYGITLVIGLAVGAGLAAVDWTDSALLVAIALSATSLGLVVAVRKDSQQEHSAVGRPRWLAAQWPTSPPSCC
jgi:Kef-type K+ transport system membrane component KefB